MASPFVRTTAQVVQSKLGRPSLPSNHPYPPLEDGLYRLPQRPRQSWQAVVQLLGTSRDKVRRLVKRTEVVSYLQQSCDLRALDILLPVYTRLLWYHYGRGRLAKVIQRVVEGGRPALAADDACACQRCGVPAPLRQYAETTRAWHWVQCPVCRDNDELRWPVSTLEGYLGGQPPPSEKNTLRLAAWNDQTRQLTRPRARYTQVVVLPDLGEQTDWALNALISHCDAQGTTVPPIRLAQGVQLSTNAQRLIAPFVKR